MSDKKIHLIQVSIEQAGQRLDRFLSTLEFISSRSRGAELIEKSLVTFRGKALKPSHKVSAGMELQIEIPATPVATLQALDSPLDVLFEDDDVIVINKPSGLVVHPAAGHAQDTLVNILLHHAQQLSMGFGENRPGIVHRLDRDTSGILVVAKNDLAHHHLAEQFRSKSAHRIYWAIVLGAPRIPRGKLRSFLARHPQDRKRFASKSNEFADDPSPGKLAVTHFKLLKTSPAGLSWIECQLETGRTHQIRVHLSEQALPIVNDPIYGSRARERKLNSTLKAVLEKHPRLALHACELGFMHPRTGKEMLFQLSWPEDLAELVQALGFESSVQADA